MMVIGITSEVADRTRRDEFDAVVSRRHFITTQDVRNIERSTMARSELFHERDAVSVRNLQSEDYDPVALYKPYGVLSEALPTLGKDDFILVIQTQHQKELYRMFGANVICIDSTHGTNAYNFKLVTMMVVDDFGEGKQTLVLSLIKKFFMKTVAWCICNREEERHLTLFLLSVKRSSPETEIRTVMTDDGILYYNRILSILFLEFFLQIGHWLLLCKTY